MLGKTRLSKKLWLKPIQEKALLMGADIVNRLSQNGSNTHTGSRVNSSDVVTSVVPTTTSPTLKLEWG